MKSLEKQLSFSLGLSLAVIFVLFWWLSITSIHKITEQYILTRLSHDTEAIIKHVTFSEVDNHWTLPEEISPIYSHVNSGHYFVIKTPQNQIFSASLNNYPIYLQKSSDINWVYETQGPSNQLVLVLGTEFTKNNQTLRVWVAEDHSPIQKNLFNFDIIFGVFSLIILISIFGLQRFWLKRGFSQLKPLEQALANLQDNRDFQINVSDYPEEISPLIENLNLALNNAKAQLEKSRHANANLAHVLKTPLNTIYQLLDQPELDTEARRALQNQAQTIYGLLERELKKARIAADALQTHRLTGEQLNDLIQSLKSLYPDIKLTTAWQEAWIRQLGLDQEDGYELFGNLLDNACKWAKSQVMLKIDNTLQGIQITIEDDGPGVPANELHNIQQRGYRLDENASGQGLGLSIVADLVDAYHFQIQFETARPNGLGGLLVTLLAKPHTQA